MSSPELLLLARLSPAGRGDRAPRGAPPPPTTPRLVPVTVASLLVTGKGKTTAGSTHSAVATAGTAAVVTRAVVAAAGGGGGGAAVVVVAGGLPWSFSLTARSSFSRAEKPLHMQSWMMMELRLLVTPSPDSNKSPPSVPPHRSASGGSRRSSDAQSRWSVGRQPPSAAPPQGTGPPPGGCSWRPARLGDRGGVGSSSNFFQMSSPGGAESGPHK